MPGGCGCASSYVWLQYKMNAIHMHHHHRYHSIPTTRVNHPCHPSQVEVIRSGVQPGLTVVVGPPGTGKTDTATQIINCLYHTCPTERTLLVAHSNQALNDLFQKIVERDVPARYLLRLGMGEEELDTDLDFSRAGRVNAMLARRLELLGQVERLAAALGAPIDMAYSCETAGHFWLLHVLARWEKFTHACKRARGEGAAGKGSGGGADGADGYSGYVRDLFPFGKYFEDAPQPLFPGTSHEEDMRAAEVRMICGVGWE